MIVGHVRGGLNPQIQEFDSESEVDTILDDPSTVGPMFSTEMLADLRAALPSLRWPRQSLTRLAIELAERERDVHVAGTAAMIAHTEGDNSLDEALAKAKMARTEAFGKLFAEQEYVGDVWLAGMSHAIQYRPTDVAELLASAFRTPAVRMAVAPVLVDLLGPTCDWLRGEQIDVRDRVADLESAAVESGVLS